MRSVLIFLFLVFSLSASSQTTMCFNRLHGGSAEILIPVNQWQGTSVTTKVYSTVGNLAGGPVTYNTADLPKVTAANGTEYYYIKRSADYSSIPLVFEVSGSPNATVYDTLQPLPQSQWNAASDADICGVAKADVCFNRSHGGYAEILIPVNQWHDTQVTVKAVDTIGQLALSPVTFSTSALPKITATSGAEYYYIKLTAGYSNIDMVFEVSSKKDASVAHLLPVLPQSQYNNFALQNSCINKPKGICMNRNNASYTLYLQKNQWNDVTARVKIYHSNGVIVFNQLYSAMATTVYNGVLSYTLSATLASYANENVIVEVSSEKNAPVFMWLSPVQQLCYEAGSCTSPVTPAFTQIAPICKGVAFSLPATSNDGITGSWSPALNNEATTTYTFLPDAGQCANSTSMTVDVKTGITWVSGSTSQTLTANTPLTNIVYTLSTGATGTTVTGLPTGVTSAINGNTFTISGTPTVAGTFAYTILTNTACGADSAKGTITVNAAVVDWTLAPNSYIFTGKDEKHNNADVDGLYIPVKKAYAMWENGAHLGGTGIPNGTISAYVYWEDAHGLIKSGSNYSLTIEGSGSQAKIKVPVNRSMKGNAVVSFHVGPNGNNTDPIYWSWHVWVTDDPTNGSTYKSFDGVSRQRKDGTIEQIPNTDWGWMDRNLGALSGSMTAGNWNKNGGLLYQWGRKDPLPPLVDKGNDFYEISGAIGRIRHRGAQGTSSATVFDNLTKYIKLSNATVSNNIPLSVMNPLSLIYVNKDDNSGQAFYANNPNTPVNWFGTSSLPANRLTELNLWSDNSRGVISGNDINDAKPYQDKSSFDPCPNGWRIPSMLVANLSNQAYIDNVRVDFSPFGVRTSMGKDVFEQNNYHIIKPTDNNIPDFMKGFRVYLNTGMDLSNVGGKNMGIFPGTGGINRNEHLGQYSDQHEVSLWTATMLRSFDVGIPAVNARTLFMIPDGGQPDVPDPAFPNVKGRYRYDPTGNSQTSDASGCRCIKDPLYKIDGYDFPTEFFLDDSYTDGLYNPNSYQVVKSNIETVVNIPVSKAFSVQSQLLNNPAILNTSNFSNLKANVLWSDKPGLVSNISLSNAAPSSLAELTNTNIVVKVAPNLSGNAVVTLHNGSINTPIYWSWHIWVTDSKIDSVVYTTDVPVSGVTNYVNYVSQGQILSTTFMDRNLGAVDSFPTVLNPLYPTIAELDRIRKSTGLQYQWGRKDPIPSFRNAADRQNNISAIYLGSTDNNGAVTYTVLNEATYNNLSGNYIVPFNTYTNAANANVLATDKISERIAKVLSYSVQHPLAYMIPSTLAPFNAAEPIKTNGTDWLANEANLAANRWGRASKKSPFDPCPEGWRIPDLTGVEIADYGVTPWYKKGYKIGLAENANIMNAYLGTWVRYSNTNSYIIGYMFNNNNYHIGNYPNAGTRGYRSVFGNGSTTGTYNSINFQYPGIWTAALSSNYRGRPISVLMNASTAANWMRTFSEDNDPYFAMSCRCAKIKYDENGNEEGAIPRLPVSQNALMKAENVFDRKDIIAMAQENKITVFPNPVRDVVRINATDDKEYYYQVYNMAGQMVKEGKFINKETDLSTLHAGNYLIRINNSESVVKIVKE